LDGDPKWCQAEFLETTGPSEPQHIREASEPLGPIIGSSVHARYSFDKGFPVHFDSTANNDGNQGRWGIDLYGTKGIGIIRMDNVPIIRMWPSPTWAPLGKKVTWQSLPGAPEVFPREPGSVGHYGEIIDDLIAAVEEDRRPRCSVHDGRAAHEFIQAAFASHIAGGARIAMPMLNREHPLTNWKA
jgi:predicted dehydrogenase